MNITTCKLFANLSPISYENKKQLSHSSYPLFNLQVLRITARINGLWITDGFIVSFIIYNWINDANKIPLEFSMSFSNYSSEVHSYLSKRSS